MRILMKTSVHAEKGSAECLGIIKETLMKQEKGLLLWKKAREARRWDGCTPFLIASKEGWVPAKKCKTKLVMPQLSSPAKARGLAEGHARIMHGLRSISYQEERC